MGNFYTNIVLKGVSLESVRDVLLQMNRKAILASARPDVTIVYDAEAEGQDADALSRLASDLSRQLRCAAWAVLNHDDNILWYRLYSLGNIEDEYDSTPGYFDPTTRPSGPSGGNAAKLAQAFGCAAATPGIAAVLRKSSFADDGYACAVSRHGDLAEALGLSIDLLALGYGYIEGGDTPGVAPEKFLRIGG